ncbi:MAG: PEP-utilizing enzyme, partial [Rhodoluna sp.]
DIYWLTDQEVEDLVGSHAPVMDGQGIIAARKQVFAEYDKKSKTLAVNGFGLIAGMHQELVIQTPLSGTLSGNGVASGLVTAEAIVVTEFNPHLDVRGKVLVVHYIDPGWTLLFTQAAAIISERGNALSHAAIISREIGIPAIVGAIGATTELKTGELIQVNGTTGEITRV